MSLLQRLRPLTLAATLLAGTFTLPAAAGYGAHGGHSVEQRFTALGLEVVELLRTWGDDVLPEINRDHLESVVLKTTLVARDRVFVERNGEKIEKEFTNSGRAANPRIEISLALWPENTENAARRPADKASLLAMALHEYAGVLGLELDHYATSAKFRNLIAERGEFTERAAELRPVLLEEIAPDANAKLGFATGADARRTCERFRQLHA